MLQKRIDDHAIISREAVREAEDIFHTHSSGWGSS